jgi:hypothetical protein
LRDGVLGGRFLYGGLVAVESIIAWCHGWLAARSRYGEVKTADLLLCTSGAHLEVVGLVILIAGDGSSTRGSEKEEEEGPKLWICRGAMECIMLCEVWRRVVYYSFPA